MKRKGAGFGIFLLIVGIIWALISLGVIKWSILDSLLTLWPLIFVVVGVNIIFKQKYTVKVASWLLFLAVLVGYGYYNGDRADGGMQSSGNFVIGKQAETDKGELKLSLGALNVDVSSGTQNLVEGRSESTSIRHSVKYSDDNRTAFLKLDQNDRSFFFRNISTVNRDCKINLNDGMVWDMDVKLGAAAGTIDMTALKVDSFDADIGAGKFVLKFGANSQHTSVKIDAGASKLEIVVPGDAGVKVKVEGIFSNTDFGVNNWELQDGFYVSPNYDEAVSKIDMDITVGAGDIKFTAVKQ